MRKWKMLSIGTVAAGLLSLASLQATAQGDATKKELDKATSGQLTGKTFDGGKTLTDALPEGNVNVPAVTGRPVESSSHDVSKSSPSASGYDVSTSSPSARGKKTGSETAK